MAAPRHAGKRCRSWSSRSSSKMPTTSFSSRASSPAASHAGVRSLALVRRASDLWRWGQGAAHFFCYITCWHPHFSVGPLLAAVTSHTSPCEPRRRSMHKEVVVVQRGRRSIRKEVVLIRGGPAPAARETRGLETSSSVARRQSSGRIVEGVQTRLRVARRIQVFPHLVNI